MSRLLLLFVVTLLPVVGVVQAGDDVRVDELRADDIRTDDIRIVPQDSGVSVRLRGISAVDAQVAWASGREGTVLRTTDGGAHWQAFKVPGASELDFRDVEGFDAQTAVVLSIGPGAASRVYRTEDAGKTWALALQNDDPRAFFDCMVFEGARGWMLGDPVDGRFQVRQSDDGGRHWRLLPAARMPAARPDEAAFAASGTCIARTPSGHTLAVSGGGAARVWLGGPGSHDSRQPASDRHASDRHASDQHAPDQHASNQHDVAQPEWHAYASGLPARVPAAGIFSAAAMGVDMLLVGGDFEHEAAAGSAARVTFDDHTGMTIEPLPAPHGYRSGAACNGATQTQCVAVGPSGVDVLGDDGWRGISDTGYDAVDAAGNVGWASGDNGRIARIEFGASGD